MNTIRTSILALGVIATAGWSASPPARRPPYHNPGTPLALAEGDDKKGDGAKGRKPKFTVGKETTYVTGPLDGDGYIDYETALNERLGKGVTPANNANVLLWKALGPRPEGGTMPPGFFKWMGIEPPPQRGEYLVDLLKYLRERQKLEPDDRLDEFFKQLNRITRRPWTAKEYPDAAAWLKANERPLAQAVEATRRSHYFNPLVTPRTKQ